jgi:hypothetical protein
VPPNDGGDLGIIWWRKMNTKTLLILTIVIVAGIAAAACGGGSTAMSTVAEKKVGDGLTVSISSADGRLKNGQQDIMLKFTDGANQPVEISAASLKFHMPAMGSMAEMNSAASLTTTRTTGEFEGKVDLEMAGEWQAQIIYEGKETGETTITVTSR